MNAQLKEDNARTQAASQLECIREMLAALTCDYDRLDELTEERDDLTKGASDPVTHEGTEDDNFARLLKFVTLENWDAENGDELAELRLAAGECEDRDTAQERIDESPLSIQIRSDWYSPGDDCVDPHEFEILLCTGGPAVRIRGTLDSHRTPSRAYMQYQDWGTPWTDYCEQGTGGELIEYCQCFYFGE